MNEQNPNRTNANLNRRGFLAATGASVIGLGLLRPGLVTAQETQQTMRKVAIGLVGCGGRGKWIADLFQKHGGYDVVALADYFQDKVDEAGQKFNVPAERRFTGLGAYRRLLEQKIEAVVIESPPYFHPEQAAAAVEAGKHVYLAKPIAVDVPGCLTVEGSGRKATEKRQVFLVDFQTRTNQLYQDAVQLVHQGELGKIISAEANYHCGPTWEKMDETLRKDPKNPEVRLKAWGVDRELSGDIITEQNIHALDVACWMLDAAPLRAYGTGSRKREFVGNCWDNFSVIYYFPNDITVSFCSHQSGFGYDDIMCRVYGFKGTVDTHYFGTVTVKTTDVRTSGSTGDLYKDGAAANIATFHKSITSGDFSNPTVPQSVRSNLTTILGRTAAYKHGLVTWKEMMRAKKKFEPKLKGLKV